MQKNHSSSTIDQNHKDSKRRLNIKIENFGPIVKGEIELKPLTVFIGPNGCGKSHAATLLYAITNIEQDYEYVSLKHPLQTSSNKSRSNLLREEAKKIHKKHKSHNSVVFTNILQNFTDPNYDFQQMFKDNFSVSYKHLIQKGKKRSTLTVKSQMSNNIRIELTADDISVTGVHMPRIKMIFEEPGMSMDDENKTSLMTTINVPDSSELFDIYDALVQRLERPPSLRSNAYYFPAERAGLTMAHKALAMSNLGRPKRWRFRDNLPTVATDYLNFLMLLSDEYGSFKSITEDAEKNIIRGKIVTAQNPIGVPDIFFKTSKYKFPLDVSASSVKDLAAFFLYTKFIAKNNDLIILEEPEINLHPKAQINLAKFIARLINNGLYVVVTTHSPYFLEQLSHCIMSGQISTNGDNSPLEPEESISPNDVASHKFVSDGNNYKVEWMGITDEGILQDEFLNIDEKMYDELLKMRRLNND